MKLTTVTEARWRVIALVMSVIVALLLIGIIMPAATAENTGSGGFVEKMKRWEDEMSQKFHDTFANLDRESGAGGKSFSTASFDLREQKDSYMVRLNLPDRDLDQVTVRFVDGALRISAPATQDEGRYEQSVALGGVGSDVQLQVERRQNDNLIVVTVPKGAAPERGNRFAGPEPAVAPLSKDWDRDVVARMQAMERDMNQIFDKSFSDFRQAPEHKGFFDEARFGSSFALREEGDNYVVRAYLPERDMKNVNVTVDGQTLKIEAREEESKNKQAGQTVTRRALYSQLVTLPGPVQTDKMKIEREQDSLVVTLPKAGA